MNKRKNSERRFVPLIAVPERLSGFLDDMLALRFPMERCFSLRDLLIALGAVLVLLLSIVIRPLAGYRIYVCLAAAITAVVPLLLSAVRLVRRSCFPAEECAVLLSAAVFFLLKDYYAAVLLPVFSTLLVQTQSYSLLQRNAAMANAPEGFPLPQLDKTEHGRWIQSGSLSFFSLLVLAAVILGITALFHWEAPQPYLHALAVCLALSGPSAAIFAGSLTHFGTYYTAACEKIEFSDQQTAADYSRCSLFVFSKTGTVTDGHYVITEVAPVKATREELIRLAALAECRSEHPIAQALKQAAGFPADYVPEQLLEVNEIPGKGVSSFYAGKQIYVGNAEFLEEHGVWFQIPARSGSAIHIAVDNRYCGYLMISDNIRGGAFEALEELRGEGVRNLTMLTGDVRSAAKPLASSLNFDLVKAQLSPSEKGAAIRYLRFTNGDRAHLACVGDGYHDADMFEEADISVCLESGYKTEADVRIRSDDIMTLPASYRICRSGRRLLTAVLTALLAAKLLFCVAGCAGLLPAALLLTLDGICGIAAVVRSMMSFRTSGKREAGE